MSSTILLPPREQLCIRYCSNKHTHTRPPGDRSALHCRWTAIATQSIGIISVQARGILHQPDLVTTNARRWEGPKVARRGGLCMRMTSGGRVQKNVPPSNTDGSHRVGPRGLLRKTGGSQSTFSSIERPTRSAAYAQLARQTLALCASGVQPKMRPCVYGCRQPRQRVCSRVSTAGKHNQIADGHMRRGHADSAEGVGAQSGKGAHFTYNGNPLGWRARERKA
jgi:hypothetical protein